MTATMQTTMTMHRLRTTNRSGASVRGTSSLAHVLRVLPDGWWGYDGGKSGQNFHTKTDPVIQIIELMRQHMNGQHGRRDVWLNRADMARLFRCTAATFDANERQLAEDADVRRDGRKTLFNASAIVERAIESARLESIDSEEAELLTGPNTPALERLRAAKAHLAELDLAKRRGELVEIAELRGGLTTIANRLRSCLETLQRSYGDEAADLLREAIDDCEQTFEVDHAEE